MNINTITAEDLRRMSDKEGLILQSCGGDLTEWVDGIRTVNRDCYCTAVWIVADAILKKICNRPL